MIHFYKRQTNKSSKVMSGGNMDGFTRWAEEELFQLLLQLPASERRELIHQKYRQIKIKIEILKEGTGPTMLSRTNALHPRNQGCPPGVRTPRSKGHSPLPVTCSEEREYFGVNAFHWSVFCGLCPPNPPSMSSSKSPLKVPLPPPP